MALTPGDVRNRQFSTVRFKEGYRLEEVDSFLDEVEAEIARLSSECDSLRVQVASLTAAQFRPAAPTPLALPAPSSAPLVTPSTDVARLPAPTGAALVSAPQDPTVEMARLLQVAQRTADAEISEARTEAASIVARAQVEAQQATVDAAATRAALERRIEELRSFEREYRSRLRAYLEGQLHDLDAGAEPPAPARPAGDPFRPAVDGPPARSTAVSAAIPPASAVPRAPLPVSAAETGPVPGLPVVPQPVQPPAVAAPVDAAPEPSRPTFTSPYSAGAPDAPPRQADDQ